MPQNDFHESRQDWDGQDRRNPPPQPPKHPKSGVKFDATINLGHMLTFLGFVIAGFTAWSTLDKRVTVIEERAGFQAQIDRNQDATMAANMAVIKEALAEIKLQLSRVNDTTAEATRNDDPSRAPRRAARPVH